MTIVAIVDDRITNRKVFSKLAQKIESGVTVAAFADPLTALAQMEVAPPDLVIVDYKMPGLDGAEFVRQLRLRPHGANVAVIVVTAYADRTFRLRALEAGATEFLQTPIDHDEFVERARHLLMLRRQQQMFEQRRRLLESEPGHSADELSGELRADATFLGRIVDLIPASISVADSLGRCRFVNAQLAALVGATPDDLIGAGLNRLYGDARADNHYRLNKTIFESGQCPPPFDEPIIEVGRILRVLRTTKTTLRRADGSVFGVLTTSIDVSDRKQAERQLLQLAQHDPLTDLPNRALLLDRLQRELDGSNVGFALHFIDLDRFKDVNESFGHQLGDDLLKEVAARLRRAIRSADTVARLGGDEFAILQTATASSDEAVRLARRVLRVLRYPFRFEGKSFRVTASIGITLAPEDGIAAEELLRKADLAMYQVKLNSKNGYARFSQQAGAHDRYAFLLESDLRRALRAGEFVLDHQPQISLGSGKVVGAEALLRWRRPGWDIVAPDQFISLAEDTGLIIPIGEWVLHEACEQAEAWRKAGHENLRIAVNLSPAQLRKQDIAAVVRRALDRSELPPTLLDLEISESLLLADVGVAGAVLGELRSLGVQASIDDFGVGQSSLAHLKELLVTRLKIDKSFLNNLKNTGRDREVISAIINLGHQLQLQVVAEGVERLGQLEELAALGCDEAQGFYVSPPLPALEFSQALQGGLNTVALHPGNSPRAPFL